MKKDLIVTVIGSGSTYTPELIDGFIAKKDSLQIRQLRLMDIDDRKRTIVGNLCKRMVERAGLDCQVELMDDLDAALTGADFVVTQIRVGKLPARILDETIPLKYDLIAQETTGIGGFFKALRTIPVMLNIAHRMEKLCPNAFLINFTNPSGIITQAIHDYSNVKCIGLCNVPINMRDSLLENLGLDHGEIEYVGLNHLSWVTKILSDGKDYLPEAIEKGINALPMKNIDAFGFDSDCLRMAQGIPCTYLEYFYHRKKKLQGMQEAEKCRGQICLETEEDLLKEYENSDLCTKPAQLELRGGAKYSLAAVGLIDAIANNKKEVHVVGVRNGKTLSFMEEHDIVEVACVIDAEGAHPLPLSDFRNAHIEAMMQTVKAYERHTVRCAVSGDEDEAIRALVVNPLVADELAARACFAEMKQAHKAFLPQFFKER